VKETVPWGKHAPLACAVDLIRGMLTISCGKVKRQTYPCPYHEGIQEEKKCKFILRFDNRASQ